MYCRACFLLLVACGTLPAANDIDGEVARLEEASPAVARSHWGALFVRLSTGEVLFSRRADSTFVPASNMKLLSTATALAKLGPGYRFTTRLVAGHPLDGGGVLNGDLTLIGGGDPTLSGRVLPYDPEARAGDPLGPLAALVEGAWRAGLRRVRGGVVGDDSRYEWEPYPEGWAWDDTLFDYGAPVSALALHDNSFSLRLQAGRRAGLPAAMEQSPALPYFLIDSRVTTAARPPARVTVDRAPGSRQVRLSGGVALRRATTVDLAVDDPAYYAAWALRELLVRRGVTVDGDVRARHGKPLNAEGFVLAHRESPPLAEILRVINKVSQNLHAEMVLREVAAASGHPPTSRTGREEMLRFAASAGIPRDSLRLEDASGLTRLALVSPAALVRLHRTMAAGPHGELWRSLLPVGGEDGTLDHRFRTVGKGQVHAKTGTLSNVGALSGFIEQADGGSIAFAVLVNGANGPASTIRDFIDKLTGLFVE